MPDHDGDQFRTDRRKYKDKPDRSTSKKSNTPQKATNGSRFDRRRSRSRSRVSSKRETQGDSFGSEYRRTDGTRKDRSRSRSRSRSQNGWKKNRKDASDRPTSSIDDIDDAKRFSGKRTTENQTSGPSITTSNAMPNSNLDSTCSTSHTVTTSEVQGSDQTAEEDSFMVVDETDDMEEAADHDRDTGTSNTMINRRDGNCVEKDGKESKAPAATATGSENLLKTATTAPREGILPIFEDSKSAPLFVVTSTAETPSFSSILFQNITPSPSDCPLDPPSALAAALEEDIRSSSSSHVKPIPAASTEPNFEDPKSEEPVTNRIPTGYRRLCVKLVKLSPFELRLATHSKFCKFLASMPCVHLERLSEDVVEAVRNRDRNLAVDVKRELSVQKEKEEMGYGGKLETKKESETRIKDKSETTIKPAIDIGESGAIGKIDIKGEYALENRPTKEDAIAEESAATSEATKTPKKSIGRIQQKKEKLRRLAGSLDDAPFLDIPGMPSANALWNFKIKKKPSEISAEKPGDESGKQVDGLQLVEASKQIKGSRISSFPIEYSSPLMRMEIETELAKKKAEEEEKRRKAWSRRRYYNKNDQLSRLNRPLKTIDDPSGTTGSASKLDTIQRSNRWRGPLLGTKPDTALNEAAAAGEDDGFDDHGFEDDDGSPGSSRDKDSSKRSQWRERSGSASRKEEPQRKRRRSGSSDRKRGDRRSEERSSRRISSPDGQRRSRDRNEERKSGSTRDMVRRSSEERRKISGKKSIETKDSGRSSDRRNQSRNDGRSSRRSHGRSRRSRSRSQRRRSKSREKNRNQNRSRSRSIHNRSHSREKTTNRRSRSREKDHRRRSYSRGRTDDRRRSRSRDRDRSRSWSSERASHHRRSAHQKTRNRSRQRTDQKDRRSRSHLDDHHETIFASDSSVSGDGPVDTKKKMDVPAALNPEISPELLQMLLARLVNTWTESSGPPAEVLSDPMIKVALAALMDGGNGLLPSNSGIPSEISILHANSNFGAVSVAKNLEKERHQMQEVTAESQALSILASMLQSQDGSNVASTSGISSGTVQGQISTSGGSLSTNQNDQTDDEFLRDVLSQLVSSTESSTGQSTDVLPANVSELRQTVEALALSEHLSLRPEQRAKAQEILPLMVAMERQARENPGSIKIDVLNQIMAFAAECISSDITGLVT